MSLTTDRGEYCGCLMTQCKATLTFISPLLRLLFLLSSLLSRFPLRLPNQATGQPESHTALQGYSLYKGTQTDFKYPFALPMSLSLTPEYIESIAENDKPDQSKPQSQATKEASEPPTKVQSKPGQGAHSQSKTETRASSSSSKSPASQSLASGHQTGKRSSSVRLHATFLSVLSNFERL